MALLEFNLSDVAQLLRHANAAENHYMPYFPDAEVGPGLILVGDQGVYLMSNGTPGLYADGIPPRDGEIKHSIVAYARGINPEVDDFNTWWDNKRYTFGGDDGAEYIPIGPSLGDQMLRYANNEAIKFMIGISATRIEAFVGIPQPAS